MLLLDGIDECGILEVAKTVLTDILASKNVHIVTTSVLHCKCVLDFWARIVSYPSRRALGLFPGGTVFLNLLHQAGCPKSGSPTPSWYIR